MEFEPMLTPREKSPLPKMSPEEDRTRDTVDSEPKHYQLSYSCPQLYYTICLVQLWLLSVCLSILPLSLSVTLRDRLTECM